MSGPDFYLAWEFIDLRNGSPNTNLNPEDWEITEESEYVDSQLGDVKVKLSNGKEITLGNYEDSKVDINDVVECTMESTDFYRRVETIKRKR